MDNQTKPFIPDNKALVQKYIAEACKATMEYKDSPYQEYSRGFSDVVEETVAKIMALSK